VEEVDIRFIFGLSLVVL